MILQVVLTNLYRRLEPLSETGRLEAQVLAAHVLGKSRAWVLAHPEAEVGPEQARAVEEAAARLERGEALPYVLGKWEFYGREFVLGTTDDDRPPTAEQRRTGVVLIPRPETEGLVERALEWLERHPERRLACDVGTGSGCIAVTLAAHIPNLRVAATDISRSALEVARRNAVQHRVSVRMDFVQADLLPPGKARFDLICANLPYIPTEKLRTLAVLRREPALALDGGADGLDLIRRLLQQAPGRITPGGLMLLEIEETQGQAAAFLAEVAFPGAEVRLLKDLAGRDRVVEVGVPESASWK